MSLSRNPYFLGILFFQLFFINSVSHNTLEFPNLLKIPQKLRFSKDPYF